MGGDHKCPVCQATFTRPQHVARHMRSHTGDRPYKCQHCGDQFARSDLLSRHINKCHANEKPVPTQGSRRKGSASASRATTSKQACDQCVQSSLPCDGSNPCAKCIQRKCRCTYVKFHRQTAPVGPGHNPRPAAPPNNIPGQPPASISSRIPIYAHPDDFFLAPAPSSSVPTTMTDTLYSSQFSFPPLYADHSNSADFASKYRAQAELLRNNPGPPGNAHFTPTGGTGGPVGPGIPGSSPSAIYSDPRSASGGSSWVPWNQDPSDPYHAQQESLHDKDMRHDSLSHRSHPQQQQHQQHHNQYVNPGLAHGLHSGAGTYPHQTQASATTYLRRGSVDFGGSEGSGSAADHSSVPSSATSSSVHLPLDNLTIQQQQQQAQGQQHPHSLAYNALDDLPSEYTGAAQTRETHEPGTNINGKLAAGLINHEQSGLPGKEGGFSSAFGLMSLDDPNVLAGLATDGAPFFANVNLDPTLNMNMAGLASLSGMSADDPDATPMPLRENPPASLPMRSASASALYTSGVGSGGTPREVDSKELRDFWKQYMRTPLSGPGPDALGSQPGADSSSHQMMSPPGPRRPRVASMPSSKTVTSLQDCHDNQDANRGGESGMRTTLNEDLRSYEAAVLARKAPTHLNLAPKSRRGTMPIAVPSYSLSSNPFSGGSPVITGTGVGSAAKFERFRQNIGSDTRPSSTSTTQSGSSGDSSLAGAFGPQQQKLQGSPHLANRPTFTLIRRGSPASSTGDSSSRASSVSVDQEGDTDDDGASGDSGRVGRLRPAFKRLASQTLGPPNAKRAFLVPSNTIDDGDVKDQRDSQQPQSQNESDYGQGYAPGALGMH